MSYLGLYSYAGLIAMAVVSIASAQPGQQGMQDGSAARPATSGSAATPAEEAAMAEEVRLAQLAWKASCPIPGIDGLCVSVLSPAPPAGSAQGGGNSRNVITMNKSPGRCSGPAGWTVPRLKIEPRKPQLAETAMQHAAKALALSGSKDTTRRNPAAATALLLQGDQQFEQFLAVPYPESLTFDSQQPKARAESQKRFSAWMERRTDRLVKAKAKYQEAIKWNDRRTTVVSAERISQLFLQFAGDLYQADAPAPPPPPKTITNEEWQEVFLSAYCEAMSDAADPLRVKAKETLVSCIERARELDADGPILKRCQDTLLKLGLLGPLPSATRPGR